MLINDSKVQQKVKDNSKEKHRLKKFCLAFFYGGLLAMVAEGIFLLLKEFANLNENNATIITSAILIFGAFILTCIGVFDKIAQIAYSGILIPITGFSNSITASALEGKSEGMIFGIGSKMFSLVGSVCTYGIVSSIFLGFIYFLIGLIK